jgi:hypothetical protein
MEFLKQAEDYVKRLEAKIAQLEKENEEKEKEIRRLSVAAPPPATTTTSSSTTPATTTTTTTSSPTAKPTSAATTTTSSLEGLEGPRVRLPIPRIPSKTEKEQLCVWEDDPALGKKAPSLKNLKYFGGSEPVAGKPLVVTFFSKLNKGDFSTLSVLSELQIKYGDRVQFLGVSRDAEEEDAAKFGKKYHGKSFAELSGPNGEPGLTVYITYPLAFDPGEVFNTEMKAVMRKAVVGVGLVILIDADNVIRWYEYYVRGFNPMGQFIEQLELLLAGKPLISNGPNTTSVTKEEAATIPDDIDPFVKKGSGNY